MIAMFGWNDARVACSALPPPFTNEVKENYDERKRQ
jgi:hypothetical protein